MEMVAFSLGLIVGALGGLLFLGLFSMVGSKDEMLEKPGIGGKFPLAADNYAQRNLAAPRGETFGRAPGLVPPG